MRRRIPLTIAMTSYDLAYPITSGELEIAGVQPAFVEPDRPGTLTEFLTTPAWDVAELPAAEYLAWRLAGNDEILALPIFLSRRFRHGSLYVRPERIQSPEDLRGTRVGVTDATTALWVRGMLGDMYGLGPDEVSFRAGTAEQLALGELDALITPVPPTLAGVRPLFERPGPAEREYLEKTRVFPILAMVGVRRAVLQEHRWLASNLYRAFEVARRRYFFRLEDIRASRVPIPAVAGYARGLRELFGGEIWPYGVQPNRPTLEALVRYAGASIGVDDLFAGYEPFVDGM